MYPSIFWAIRRWSIFASTSDRKRPKLVALSVRGADSNKALPTTALLVLALIAHGCGQRASDIPEDPVIASVDGHEIPASWFRQTYFEYLVRTGANDTRGNRYLHLDELIDAFLLADEARRLDYDKDSLSRVFEVRELKKALGGRFYEEEFLQQVPPLDEGDVRRAFANSKKQVTVRHLFYLNPDSARAAYERLEQGVDFLDEAQRCYGLATYDSTAGFLGPVRYFMMDDAFADVAYGLAVGEYSAPVQSRFGYHIIRVESIVRSALLTESEYQTRRSGIEKRERLRKTRLSGDRFVRELMADADVRVNSPAVRALNLLIRDAERSVDPKPVPVLDPESADAQIYRDMGTLDLDTPLATFRWGGDENVFTLGDYFFWLPELPYAERRTRTGASVGRALRNEVLALEGERRGLEDDRMRASVERETALFLARRLIEALRADTTVSPTEEQLRTAYKRFGLDRRELVDADFWMIPFGSLEEALSAKAQTESRPGSERRLKGYTHLKNEPLDRQHPTLRYYVRQAHIAETTIVGLSAETWILLHVEARRSRPASFEASRQQIERRMRPYIAEYNLLERLRTEATVRIDSTRFERIMELEGTDAES